MSAKLHKIDELFKLLDEKTLLSRLTETIYK